MAGSDGKAAEKIFAWRCQMPETLMFWGSRYSAELEPRKQYLVINETYPIRRVKILQPGAL